MSGDNESPTIDNKLEKLDELLNEYESTLGIPKTYTINTEKVKEYLQLTRDDLKLLSAEDCDEISFALSQASYYILRECNKEKSKYYWADAQINGIIAAKVSEYKGYSFEERKLKAIMDNSAAIKLNSIKVNAKLRIDRLDGISQKIEFMSKSIKDLKFLKRNNDNG